MLRCVVVYKFRLTSNKLCGFSLCQNDMSFNNFCITKKIAIPSGAFVVLTNINLEFTEIYNRIASLLEPQNLKCIKYQPFMANRIHLGGKTSELFCVHVITLQHFTQCPSTCKIGLWCWQPAVFDTAHPLCVAIVCYCRACKCLCVCVWLFLKNDGAQQFQHYFHFFSNVLFLAKTCIHNVCFVVCRSMDSNCTKWFAIYCLSSLQLKQPYIMSLLGVFQH